MAYFEVVPSVFDYPEFNEAIDGDELRAAMKGFGTDEQTIIDILTARSNYQRQAIALYFEEHLGRNLIDDLKSELGGNFENVIIALMLPPVDYLCKELHASMKGLGTDTDSLTEILCARSKEGVQQLVDRYESLYDRPLAEHVCSETSGDYRRLLTLIITGVRNDPGVINADEIVEQAAKLYEAGEGKLGTSEEIFIRIFAHESFEHLHCVFEAYKNLSGVTIEQSLKKEMSGDLLEALLTIAEYVRNPPAYFAKQLQQACDGIGTNDRKLIRLIVSRSEIDLGSVRDEFERIYGKTLESVVRGETSGDYKRALVTLIGGP